MTATATWAVPAGAQSRALTVAVAYPPGLISSILVSGLEADGLVVVATFGSVADILAGCAAHSPDVLLCPPVGLGDGLALCVPGLIAAGTRILVISDGALDEAGSQLLLAGASGFLITEDLGLADIGEAVRTVAAGRTALHPDVAMAVFEQWRAKTATAQAAVASGPATLAQPARSPQLTGRESQVLQAVSEGLSLRETSRRLGIAEKTVEAHRTRLFTRLGARNQSHALAIAHAQGLLSG